MFRSPSTRRSGIAICGCLLASHLAWTDAARASGITPQTVLYGESTSNLPPYRQWNGTAWPAAATATNLGANPRWVVLRNCPTRNELVAVCSDASNNLTAMIYNGTSWSAIQTLTSNLTTSTERPYYAAYQQSSGNALVAYRVGNASTLYYRTWNGTAWSAQSSVAISGAGYPTFIKLVPRPTSDEIVAVVLDTSRNVSALVWNGSSFGSGQLLDANGAFATEECMDAAYEQLAKRCLVAWSRNGSSTPRYSVWTGSAWNATSTLPAIGSGTPKQLRVVPDPASDKILAVLGSSATDLHAATWSGSAWGSLTSFGATQAYTDCRSFDAAFEPGGTRALCVFSQDYLPNWTFRKPITIDYTKVSGGSSLTNFPVLVSLASDADLAAHAQSSGNDILFTSSDGVTQLSHEIESYTSATGALVAWVKVPTVSASANTILYMYYGNPNASNQQNPTGVWTNNYNGVWHLNGSAADSTTYANNGTISGATAIAGQFGQALKFNDTSDYVSAPNAASLQLTTAMTVEGWVRLSTFGVGTETDTIIRKGDDNPNNFELSICNQRAFYMLDGSDDCASGAYGSSSLSANTWYYVVGAWNGTTETIYLNGTSNGTYGKSSPIGTDTRSLYIGGRIGTDVCDGRVDEVRLSSVARTAGWILTQYRNLSSPGTFYALGSPQMLTNLYYRTFDGTSWSATQTGPATTSVPNVIQLAPSLTGSEIFLGASGWDRSLYFVRWNGTSLTSAQSLSTTLAGSVQSECFMFSDSTRKGPKVIRWREVPNP